MSCTWECAFKIFCDVMEKRNIEMTKTLCSRYVLWDLICASWYVCEGLWSPRFFHFRVEKSLGVSPLWSIKRYRNFKSLLQNESLYSSLHLLKAVGSQGRSISGSKEQSMFLRLCIALYCLYLFIWEIEKAPLKLSLSLYVQQKCRSYTLVLSRVVVWNVQFSQETFFLKTYFLTERSN